MDEFINSYYVAQMTIGATQIANNFKYFKANVERDVSAAMAQMSSQNADESLDMAKMAGEVSKTRAQFVEGVQTYLNKMKLIRKIAEQLKVFLGMPPDKRKEIFHKIFLTFLMEYLFKHKMRSTIHYLKNFQASGEDFMDSGIEKYQSFIEMAKNLDQGKTERLADWCRANRSKLKKLKSNLEFKVHARRFYELAVEGKAAELLPFLQNKISSLTGDPQLICPLLEVIMGELPTEIPPNYSIKMLTSDFCQFYFEVEGFNRNYFLENLISVGSKDGDPGAENRVVHVQGFPQTVVPRVLEVAVNCG